MDRTYGRAPGGVRVDGPVPHGHWKVVTLTAAVRLGGVPEPACLAFDGPTDTAWFETYVAECLAPTLRPGDIVVMDNLSSHKTAEVARLIAAAGAEVRYLPAYSPDLNPIERLFSKLKEALRSAKARTIGALIEAMGAALRAIRPEDILGWFRHSGYRADESTARLNGKLLYRRASASYDAFQFLLPRLDAEALDRPGVTQVCGIESEVKRRARRPARCCMRSPACRANGPGR